MIDNHPFSPANVAFEGGAPDATETRWLKWCEQAEMLLGHSLDGNDVEQAGCGYSLDEAHEAWRAKVRPQSYAEMVTGRPRYHRPA